MLPVAAWAAAKRVEIENHGVAGNAAAGDQGVGNQEAAAIFLQVTDAKGKGLDSLGDTVGNGSGVVNLPTGWSMVVVTGPGAAPASTQFVNFGGGTYSIRLSSIDQPWASGDYFIRLAFQNSAFRGSTLVKVTIP
jgi:hypothetical protein